MRKSDFITKLTSFWVFYRWHPEVALRYLPLVRLINKMGDGIKVLEVGSGGLGIVPYLKKTITGVDVKFKPPIHPLLTKVRASATKLPFTTSSFDVVLSVDMLEHLSSSNRTKAVKEMIRVAKKKVLIAVPCGTEAYEQDLRLDKIYKDQFGYSYDFFEEQIRNGLPEKEEMHDMISSAAKNIKKRVKTVIIGNESLKLRNWLMKGWMTDNVFFEFFFRKILLLALPMLIRFNKEPVYRQIFFIDIVYENCN